MLIKFVNHCCTQYEVPLGILGHHVLVKKSLVLPLSQFLPLDLCRPFSIYREYIYQNAQEKLIKITLVIGFCCNY